MVFLAIFTFAFGFETDTEEGGSVLSQLSHCDCVTGE